MKNNSFQCLDPKWQGWVQRHRQAISDGFEFDFVVRVLSKLSSVSPDDVTPQYPFVDGQNRNRRIDFVIQNGTKGHFLAIELDGARRGQNELQAQWADFLSRQNDLLEQVGPLLRFSNSQMFRNSNAIIERINKTLYCQAQKHLEAKQLKEQHDTLESETYRLKQSLRQATFELKSLKEKSKSAQDSINPDAYNEMQQRLHTMESAKQSLEAKYERDLATLEQTAEKIAQNRTEQLQKAKADTELNLKKTKKENQLMLRTMYILTGIIVIALGAVFFKLSNMEKESTPVQASINAPAPIQPIKRASISAKNARHYIGQTKEVCGKVVQVSDFKKGIYLNLEENYPNQAATFVIWEEHIPAITRENASPYQLKYFEVCAYGKIEEYKGVPRINVSPASFHVQ